MLALRTLDNIDVADKRVLLRVDLNVPLRGGDVTDATRIGRILPTLREITSKGGKVILLSHFGRPRGRDPESSLRPIAAAVASALRLPVAFCEDCIGREVRHAISKLTTGTVLLLENTRFYPEEERNDPLFAQALAGNGDLFVSDAFSAAHRAHASTVGLAHVLPAYAGRAMQAEIEALQTALEKPERPVTALIGGSKISTKLPILKNLIGRVDNLIIGGAMASTFLLANGASVGQSLVERDLAGSARELLSLAQAGDCKIVLPLDAVCARELRSCAQTATFPACRIPDDHMVLDVGPRSQDLFSSIIASSRTLLWNGPLGAFETPPFDQGTFALAQYVAELTQSGKLTTVAGGGDTIAALNAAGVTERFTHASTAGGAFLEWLEGRTLAGVAVLMR